jgi:hypothetical protein
MKEEKNYESESVTKNSEMKKKEVNDVPSIRLSPEQIEEIHADEYSLVLFYATRMQPMSIGEIKRQFVETEPKKAESVMERFLKVGLTHKTEDGKFYSNFPNNYINYSEYRYDGDLEARKDAKVFQIMKEQTGKKEFWKDKAYFSIDAFFTDEQSSELNEMLKEVKLKAKHFANQNDKLTSKGMKFRRFKFYDMFWAIALFAITFSLTAIHPTSNAFASHGGGNDPVGVSYVMNKIGNITVDKVSGGGGGNDPTASVIINDPTDNQGGGGGHDPEGSSVKCEIVIEGKVFKGFINEENNSCVLSTEFFNIDE